MAHFTGTLGVQSNAADWSDAIKLVADDDGGVTLTGCTATMNVKSRSGDIVLRGGTVTGEITFPQADTINFGFAASRLSSLIGLYDVSLIVTASGDGPMQFFLGNVEFVEGF